MTEDFSLWKNIYYTGGKILVDQQVDWISAPPGQGLADAVNESIRRHAKRNFRLEEIHELEQGPRQNISLMLLYEK